MTILAGRFTTADCERSNTAVRIGIDNRLPDALHESAVMSAKGMVEVEKILEAETHISSWYRCEALERILSARDFARWCEQHKKDVATAWPEYFARKGHPQAECVDFTAPGHGTPADVAKTLAESGLKFDQIVLEGTWVHIRFSKNPRGEVLTATFNNGIPNYQKGLA